MLADDETQLLQLVWDALVRTGNWPTFEAIDRTLLSRHDDAVDLPELIARIPPLFLHGGRPQGGARADPDGSLSLTVAGAAVCSGTEEVIQVVVAAARLGADAYRKGDPAQPAVVTFDQVLEELELDLSEAEEKELGRRSAMLLVWEPWRGSSTNNDGRWTFNVDRDIRLYKGVTTFDEYWQARVRQLAVQQALTPSGIWAPTPYGVGTADAPQPDLAVPSHTSTPEAEQPPAGKVINNHFHAPSNVAIDSTNVKQSIKPPKGGDEMPAVLPQHPETSATTASDADADHGSHPLMVFGGAAISLFGILPAVIQATKAIWAQVTGASLVVLTVLLLILCWFKWNRSPRMRKAGLVIAGILALGICAVLILGNSSL
ncbi:hypothetical protein [Kribbella antiqua]|uniref:hypothetical protein n=1 Tax=Kribbella antiqua TaxID=2512217 RepID=UPI001045A67C|nr:hypothetical protein [Kribbella antiqua]